MTVAPSPALATYRELLGKVDAKFAQIQARHAAAMTCHQGCHGCCKPGLTVSPIEAINIATHLKAHPDTQAAVTALAAADPHGGTRCAFLTAAGTCAIYAVRPLVCRSHGAPIAFKLETSGAVERDVCPLNFTDEPLPDLAAGDHINLDMLNTILALLNQQAAGKGAAGQRVPLRSQDVIDFISIDN